RPRVAGRRRGSAPRGAYDSRAGRLSPPPGLHLSCLPTGRLRARRRRHMTRHTLAATFVTLVGTVTLVTSACSSSSSTSNTSDSGGGGGDAGGGDGAVSCGAKGDTGNALGIGKYCDSALDCNGTQASLCATAGDPG